MKLIALLIFSLFVMACTSQKMKVSISKKIEIPPIPSGSGIIKIHDHYYVLGDDSPYLFKLNNGFEVEEKIPLQNRPAFTGRRVSKPEKADFEALEMIGENELVIFGSGSKSPERDTFVHILLEHPVKIERYSISDFYNKLKSLSIFSDSELNIEAAAFENGHLFLFNRKKNIVLNFEFDSLFRYLKGTDPFPDPAITQFTLPRINGIEAGFSGATVVPGRSKIIFTASVENTANAYDDGEILGSFIGTLVVQDGRISDTIEYCRLPHTQGVLKVESVAVDQEISNAETQVVLITDNDKGRSIAIKAIVTW